MFEKIFAAVDGSTASESGLDLAIELAKALGSTLVLAHVVTCDDLAANAGAVTAATRSLVAVARAYGRRTLEAARAQAARAGVRRVEMRIVDADDAVLALHDLVQRERPDLIVMGSHKRTALGRLLLGSVSDGIMRRSTVPVVIAPHRTPTIVDEAIAATPAPA
jgi:nucleotide-binding universal stress UspA family protein